MSNQALEQYLIAQGLSVGTRKKYLTIADRIGDANPVQWFTGQLTRKLATNTLLPMRAAAKYVLIVQHGMDAFDADRALPKAKGRTTTVREGLTKSQVPLYDKSVATLKGSARTVLQLLPWTGLRIEEACSLRWVDVEKIGEQVILHVRAGKGGKARKVPLSKTPLRILARHRRENNANGVHMFPGYGGSPLSPGAVRAALKRATKGIKGLEDVVPHTLRHTYASKLAARGVPLDAITALLGHASIRSTERYLHPTIDTLSASVNKLED